MIEFSVLLSVYYKENSQYLCQSLDSIINQTWQPTEIVLVKDGLLTNELEQIVQKYQSKYNQLKVVALSHNVGLGKALNEGLKYCSYDIVARMDTDDIAKHNRFEEQLIILQDNSEIDVVSSWVDEFEEQISNVKAIKKVPEKHSDIYQYARKRNPINHPVVVFRKSSVMEAGGYQHFPLLEDYYLWIRMLKKGAKFYNVQKSLLFFRTSCDMYKRRGGWKYMLNEIKFQKMMRELKFISIYTFCYNIIIRFVVRLFPNKFRLLLYQQILRK